jgi:hypothetical protein
MPFWQFFGATLLGKACVKVNGQVCRSCETAPYNANALIILLGSITYTGKPLPHHRMQALFFVALFRRSTRDRVLAAIEGLLPHRIPGLNLSRTPAEELHAFIERSITRFQVRGCCSLGILLSIAGLLVGHFWALLGRRGEVSFGLCKHPHPRRTTAALRSR